MAPTIPITIAVEKTSHHVQIDPQHDLNQVLTTIMSAIPSLADANALDYCVRFMENDELMTDVVCVILSFSVTACGSRMQNDQT
jgi:hypothetical protein